MVFEAVLHKKFQIHLHCNYRVQFLLFNESLKIVNFRQETCNFGISYFYFTKYIGISKFQISAH